jgi:hypothetical protein
MNYDAATKHKYEFSIRGSLETDYKKENLNENEKDKKKAENSIHILNSNKFEIAGKINDILERRLPSSYHGNVKIETQIDFGLGSITWVGVIIVLDWVGKIVDTITFVQIMTGAIQFAVNKVIMQETSRHSIPTIYDSIYTTVIPEFVPSSQTDFLYRNLLLRQDEQIRLLRNMSRNFENLPSNIVQRIIMFRSQNLNLSSSPKIPAWKANLIIILLVVIAVIQLITYFGLDTVKGWLTIFTDIFR